MRSGWCVTVAIVAVCGLSSGFATDVDARADSATPQHAEVVLRGGAIYTMDPGRPLAEAVAIAQGRILAVGDDRAIARHAGPKTRIVELQGRTVLPGLHDAHIHPMSAGIWLLRCRLDDALNAAALRRTIKSCVANSSGKEWFIARGWREHMLDRTSPARAFEGIVEKRPAVLVSAQGDRMWLNARAFDASGLGRSDKDNVVDGLERDGNGGWTGFVNGAAAGRVRSRMPQPSQAEYRRSLRHVTAQLNARGVTALTDASVTPPMLDAYRAAAQQSELTVRVSLARRFDSKMVGLNGATISAADPSAEPWMLRDNLVKIFVDGEFPERNAALLNPYADAPHSRGESHLAAADLDRAAAALDAAGFDLHLHAMGDRAVRMSLDAIERAIAANGPRDRRHQIAHLALVDRNDLPRFKALGVIANLQLEWAKPKAFAKFEGPARLGPQRTRRLLAFADLAAHGAMLVTGSDGPLPSLDPFAAMQAGATYGAGGRLITTSSKALPVSDLLRYFTRNGAHAARAERFSGAIVPGMAADLIVIDQNPLEIDAHRIGETRVLLTLLGGRAVHVEPGFAWP